MQQHVSSSPSSGNVSGRSRKRKLFTRVGLQKPLVCLLLSAAAVFVGSAFFNETSMRQFYGNQLPDGVDFDAPILHSRNTTKLPLYKDLNGSPKKDYGKPIEFQPHTNTKGNPNDEKERQRKRLGAESFGGSLSSVPSKTNVTKSQSTFDANKKSSSVVKTTKKALDDYESEISIPVSTTVVNVSNASQNTTNRISVPQKDANPGPVKASRDEESLEEGNEGKDLDMGEEVDMGDPEDGEVEGGEEDVAADDGEVEEEVGVDDAADGAEDATPMATNRTILSRPWLKFNRTTAFTGNRTMVPFERQDDVVIVTKIHGKHQLLLLEQSLCLLHFAYNRRPLYPIIVFTTLPVPEEDIAKVQKFVHPANLTFVVDNRGLQQEIAALSKPRYDAFLKACGVDSPVNLTWWSNCPGRVAYNWQAEFRAWHIWRHPALAKYSYMMWLDTDAFCTEEWMVDPIQAVVENNLVVLFDNWPKGAHKGSDVVKRIYKSFGVHLCKMQIIKGHFKTNVFNETCKESPRLGDIHGFFHITNLDFYRSDPVQKWAETWIGDGFLQRRYDDQAAVTMPAAILAPDRAWDMRRNKIRLNVAHNGDLDGKKTNHIGGFKKYWRNVVQQQLPDAVGVCPVKASN